MRLEKHYDIRTNEIVLLDIDRHEVVGRYFDEFVCDLDMRWMLSLKEPLRLEDSRLWC